MSTKRTPAAKAETAKTKTAETLIAETLKSSPVETLIAETVETPKTAETKSATITGLTLKGLPETARKIYGESLKNGKENSYYEFSSESGRLYKIAVNFDSFDSLMKSIPVETLRAATITATYKLRENGKTVRNMTVEYGGESGEKFETFRKFYDRPKTGGIDTAKVETPEMIVLYVNRMSRFSEFSTVDGLPEITEKAI